MIQSNLVSVGVTKAGLDFPAKNILGRQLGGFPFEICQVAPCSVPLCYSMFWKPDRAGFLITFPKLTNPLRNRRISIGAKRNFRQFLPSGGKISSFCVQGRYK